MTRAAVPRISVAEAAEYHRCSQKTIRRAITAGILPAYRLGPRLIRIDPRDLDRLARRIPAAGGADVT